MIYFYNCLLTMSW